MTLVDTHTHLFSEKFDEDRAMVVDRAIAEGVKLMFLPNINSGTISSMLALHEQYPNHCLPMLGLHPCDVNENFANDLELMKPLFDKHKFYGIGETGIDLYWDKSTLNHQKESLRIQIKWAKEYSLPIIIHARDSYDELFEVFDEENDERLSGVFHCFTGTIEQANRIIAYGDFRLGIGGVLTFKNSGLSEVVSQIDLDHLLLETDSPYLAPHPNRGKRNESSYIHYVASKLADAHGCSIDVVSKKTTENACETFKLELSEFT